MVVFSITDVTTFVIRLVVFFLVVGVLIFLFVSLGEISRGSELERKLNELGEAMLTSEFTTARAVFDPMKPSPSLGGRSMYDINNSDVEPMGVCNYMATFEFLRYSASKGGFERAYVFGIVPNHHESGAQSREWAIWMNETGGIVPGRMRITLSSGPFARFACAVKRAAAYKAPTSIEFSFQDICGVGSPQGCNARYSGGVLCTERTIGGPPQERCREIGIEMNGPSAFSAWHHTVSIFPVKDVPGAIDRCPSPTTFQNETEREQYAVKKVVICETHED